MVIWSKTQGLDIHLLLTDTSTLIPRTYIQSSTKSTLFIVLHLFIRPIPQRIQWPHSTKSQCTIPRRTRPLYMRFPHIKLLYIRALTTQLPCTQQLCMISRLQLPTQRESLYIIQQAKDTIMLGPTAVTRDITKLMVVIQGIWSIGEPRRSSDTEERWNASVSSKKLRRRKLRCTVSLSESAMPAKKSSNSRKSRSTDSKKKGTASLSCIGLR